MVPSYQRNLHAVKLHGVKDCAAASAVRDFFPSIIGDSALDVSDAKASLNHGARCNQFFAADWTHEMDVQIDRRKVLSWIERSSKGDSHRGVRQGRQNTAMHTPHRIMKPIVHVQLDNGSSQGIIFGTCRLHMKPHEL